MAEPVCRHGVRMDRSCLKCARYLDIINADFRSKQANFDRSIKDLEAMLVPLLAELAKAQSEVDALDGDSSPAPNNPGQAQPPPEDPRLWYKR